MNSLNLTQISHRIVAALLVGAMLASCGGGSSGTGSPTGLTADQTAPTVLSINPDDKATGFSVNSAINATFSEAMQDSTVLTNFHLFNGASSVAGTVDYSDTTATFKPSGNLAYSTEYTATITTGVKDLAGNAIATAYTWKFTTGIAPDNTPPTVVAPTSPATGATAVAVNSAISATFSEAMQGSTVLSNFTLSNGANSVLGTVSYSGTTVTFKPTGNLADTTEYTATITTGVKDLAGNAIATVYTWKFTTGIAPDITPPTVVAPTSPATGAIGVFVKAPVTANFSEAMQAASILPSFTLFNGANSVAGTVTYSGTTATFKSSTDLAYATLYTATLSTGIKDLANNAMVNNYTWTFTSRTQPLNDTGITPSQCYQAAASDVLGVCSGAAITLSPTQDGMVGRDVTTPLSADGKQGFSFTLVGGGACVQDNITGLMWESKTAVGSGLHDGTIAYTNLGDNSAGDASTFVTAVNAATLCGFNDWRLPTVDELHSIVDYGVAAPGPTIDTIWFPNTQGSGFWSSSPFVGDPAYAWFVGFEASYVGSGGRTFAFFVRLVRAGQ